MEYIVDDVKLAIIGDIHEHEIQFNKIFDVITPSEKMILISVGDIYDKGFGREVGNRITNKFMQLVDQNIAYVICGNHEFRKIKDQKKHNKHCPYIKWFSKQPLSLSFTYNSSKNIITIVHGGVTPKTTWFDLQHSLDVLVVRTVDPITKKYVKSIYKVVDGIPRMIPSQAGSINWHKLYDGRFGYIVSGHDSQKDGIPKFYDFSCNLDSCCYNTGKLTVQIFGSHGREQLFFFDGPAKGF
jgi:uncharacterized protein YbaR (Trm112 family)